MWRHGRTWVYFGSSDRNTPTFRVEWVIWDPKDKSFSIKFELNSEWCDHEDLRGQIRLPFLGAFYWGINNLFSHRLRDKLPKNKSTGLQIYEEYIWIDL